MTKPTDNDEVRGDELGGALGDSADSEALEEGEAAEPEADTDDDWLGATDRVASTTEANSWILGSVRLSTWLFVSTIWMIVGFYLWIPAVFAASCSYAFGVMAAAFLSRPAVLKRTTALLNRASTLYLDGFRSVHIAVFRPERLGPVKADTEDSLGEALLLLLATGVGSVVAASVFWFGVAIAYSFVVGETYWLDWLS